METDTNFRKARGKVTPGNVPSSRWHALRENLDNLPDCRPGFVERAKELIDDPDFPDPVAEQEMAEQMAVQIYINADKHPG
jgi:hypothetical protein